MKPPLLPSLLFLLCISLSLKGQITQNHCVTNSPIHIVVLGSSTAAGAGASTSDSSWVGRYRNALQAINPNITVTNLAVGGYTTYRLMPNNFVPPANRPTPDVNKNITKALSLNPNAIIINLPSNDRQWPVQEQLSNFDSLYNHSIHSGVPIYICTTQPIASATSAYYQRTARDSIMAMFGAHAIDVFTPLAAADSTVIAAYAADAVHLNNTGHNVLFNTVWNKDILVDIIRGTSTWDAAAIEITPTNGLCADSAASIDWKIGNYGDSTLTGVVGYALVNGPGVNDSVVISTPSSIAQCDSRIVRTTHNLSAVGTYHLELHINVPNDTLSANNSISTTIKTVTNAHVAAGDYLYCPGDTFEASHVSFAGDSLFWQTQLNGSPSTPPSPIVITPSTDTILYAFASSGDFNFKNSLRLYTNNNLSWNGNMFDLYADTNLTITGINFVAGLSGTLHPRFRIINGSYRGHETIPGDWTLTSSSNSIVSDSIGHRLFLPLNLTMQKGDTLGIYFDFKFNENGLRYMTAGSPVTSSNAELTYLSGSGSHPNFGGGINHRLLDATVKYKFGFNHAADCHTNVEMIRVRADTVPFDIGSDTTLSITHSITYTAPAGSTNHFWVDGNGDTLSTAQFITLDSSNITSPMQLILYGESSLGCASTDEVVITLVNDISIAENGISGSIYPNPSKGVITLDGFPVGAKVEIFNLNGESVLQTKIEHALQSLEILNLPSSVYVIHVSDQEHVSSFRMILTR